MSTQIENDAARRTMFDGTWIGERDIPVEVTSEGQMVTLKYGNNGTTFHGFVGRIGMPVIYALFKGDTPHTGVLTEDHNHVRWSNNTDWRRAG